MGASVFKVREVYENELNISLKYSNLSLAKDFELATGACLWEEVESLVTEAIPDSAVVYHCLGGDHDPWGETFIALPLSKFLKESLSYVRQKEKYIKQVEQLLEQEAQRRWLRPGVPSLYTLVKASLKSKEYLVTSVIEYQRQFGYDSTTFFFGQFRDELL